MERERDKTEQERLLSELLGEYSSVPEPLDESQREAAEHRRALSETLHRRLRVLEQQAAYFGPRCPPEIILEISDIKSQLKIYSDKEAAPSFSSSTQSELFEYFSSSLDRIQDKLGKVAIKEEQVIRIFGIPVYTFIRTITLLAVLVACSFGVVFSYFFASKAMPVAMDFTATPNAAPTTPVAGITQIAINPTNIPATSVAGTTQIAINPTNIPATLVAGTTQIAINLTDTPLIDVLTPLAGNIDKTTTAQAQAETATVLASQQGAAATQTAIAIDQTAIQGQQTQKAATAIAVEQTQQASVTTPTPVLPTEILATPTATSLPTSTPTSTPSPEPVPFDGQWSGSATSGGSTASIQIEIRNNSVYRFAIDEPACPFETYPNYSHGIPISDNTTSFSGSPFHPQNGTDNTITFSVTIAFSSTNKASGTVQAQKNGVQCADVQWSATKQ
jgi:hypothetical protein